MYSILIIDEKCERELLSTYLSTSMLNLNHIYEAENYEEAINLYDIYQPLIIIFDIHFRGCNGLKCANMIKKMAGKRMVKFIIQTAYVNFSYMHEAICIGVEDYLLKPVNQQKIMKSIACIIDSCQVVKNQYLQTSSLLHQFQHMKRALEIDCMKQILTKQGELLIQKRLTLLHITMKSGFCIIVKDYFHNEESILALESDIADCGYYSLIGMQEQHLVIFVLYLNKLVGMDLERIKRIMINAQMFEHEIGIGEVAHKADDLHASYLEAMAYASKRQPEKFQICKKIHLYEEDENTIDCKECVLFITHAFENQDDACILKKIRSFVKTLLSLSEGKINGYINEFVRLLEEQLTRLYHVDYMDSTIHILNVTEANKYQTLEVWMIYTVHTLLIPIKHLLYQNVNQLTKRALKYMRKHYNKAISLNDVAGSLSVSPFYLSKLLNGQLHKKFTDIIMEYRIEHAKQLLKDHHSIKEAASMVGFHSSGYFSKSFKRLIGVTPTEYRDIFI